MSKEMEKLEQLGSTFEEFKKQNDKELAEIKASGTASAEQKQMVERINTDLTKLGDEVKAVRTALNRSGTAAGDQKEAAKESAERASKAYQNFLRGRTTAEDIKAMNDHRVNFGPEGYKALTADSDPNGGYWVRPEVSSEIVQKVFETSPMRQICDQITISSDSFEIAEDLGEFDANWVGERTARAETANSELKKIVIAVHELEAMPKASQRILDDAAVNVEAWISGKLADKFGRLENTAFVSGNGVGKPKGILSYASGTTGYNDLQQVGSGSAGAFTADGLITLSYSLKAPYKQGAVFLMQRASVALIRKLKDSQNRYLWEPGLNGPGQDMLLGFPILEADDMAAAASGSLSAAFGNFKAGYQIVDRIGIRTLRDPFSAKPYVLFYSTKRVGGGVKNFEAIKLHVLT
jgi:HK97 family phage major capsid protein